MTAWLMDKLALVAAIAVIWLIVAALAAFAIGWWLSERGR